MASKQSKLALLALVGSILASGQAKATLLSSTQEEDLRTAELMAELIERGHIKVDPKTGKLVIESSVLEILKDNGLVKDLSPNDMQMAGGCNSTTGGCPSGGK